MLFQVLISTKQKVICSEKTYTKLQKVRHMIAKQAQETQKVDIFGLFSGKRVNYKSETLKDYRFQIVVENDISPYYFSEKIMDCFISMTVPIYLGATRIDKFFNMDGIIPITFREGEEIFSIPKLVDICNEKMYESCMPAIIDNYHRALRYLNLNDLLHEEYFSNKNKKNIFCIFYVKYTELTTILPYLEQMGGGRSVILQYALGLKIAKKTGRVVKYDTSWFNGESLDCDKKHKYKFMLKKLFPNINYLEASTKEIEFYKHNFYYFNKNIYSFNSKLFTSTAPTYYDGYYQHYKYWIDIEEDLQRNLDFSSWKLDYNNEKTKDDIISAQYSIGVHVRRGDFLKLGWCVLEPTYYIKAINEIIRIKKTSMNSLKEIKIFFFSNDIKYVKKEILPFCRNKLCKYKVIDHNDVENGHFDMYLLSLCNAQVLANSTFSVCSSLLNKHTDKILIAPNTWGHKVDSSTIVSMEESIKNPAWIILDCKTGERIS